MPTTQGFRLPARRASNARPVRRSAVISVAVALGLVLSSAAVAEAAGADSGSTAGKQARLQQLKARAAGHGGAGNPTSGDRHLDRLAAARDSGSVVLSVKVRGGSAAPTALAAVGAAAKSKGAEPRRVLRQLGTVSVEVPQGAAAGLKATLQARPDVVRVDTVARRQLTFVPNDQRYTATAPYLDAVAAPAAWSLHRGDGGVKIAVVDTGVDVHHPDLAGRISDTYNAVPGVPDVTDVTDDFGHGTFVAGVAAATGDNGIGIAGASMGASVMAVKVADSQGDIWTDAEAAGITWAADHGARVINLSLGSPIPDQLESDAVAYAISKGVLVVAAAGNDGDTTPSYPAAYPNVVAVGATDAAGHRASFSQHGSWVTVGAPGTGITGTAPTAGSVLFSDQSGYAVSDGTSFSAPIVSAEAALLWSLRPSISAEGVRAAIVSTAHGYAGLELGAGQVDFRAADDTLRPVSVPTLNGPADGAAVGGPVTLTATSTAPKVRFLIDGTPLGAPVPVNDGTATAQWSTWGLPNGAHSVGAVDCLVDALCNSDASQVSVTLTNAVPVITSPTSSQTLSGSATFTATAPGGAVAFLIDGVRRGLDTTAPYALTYPVSSLADGTHSVTAVSCSTAGGCNGPSAAAISFKALSLHPRFSAVAPSLFSPNQDGRYDTTKATYVLPDTETVRFQVRNAAGAVVRGPIALGTLAKGTRSYVWNGLLNGGTRAPSGAYTLELATSSMLSGATVRGSAVTTVQADLVAPALSSITGSGAGFYPYPDGYQDTFSPALALSEKATLTLTVKTGAANVVRTLSAVKPAGRTSITWNGRNTAGSLVPAGTYYWTLTAQDPAGNRRTSARYSVTVSGKRLVSKTTTLVKTGSAYYSAGGSASWCSDADKGLSAYYPSGVWLSNACDPSNLELATATYRFALPAAASYTSLRIDSYGFSMDPSRLGAGFTRWGTSDFTMTPEITAGTTESWRSIGSVSPTGLVNSSRVVETTLYVPNHYYGNDYDIGQVRLVVAYKVLA